jgi:hypothetical protein
MMRRRAPRILPEAAASGVGRSSWLISTPPVGLALLAVLYAWISGMTVLGDALLILIKVAAVLLAIVWAAAALPRRFGSGLRSGAVAPALAVCGLGAAGVVSYSANILLSPLFENSSQVHPPAAATPPPAAATTLPPEADFRVSRAIG